MKEGLIDIVEQDRLGTILVGVVKGLAEFSHFMDCLTRQAIVSTPFLVQPPWAEKQAERMVEEV